MKTEIFFHIGLPKSGSSFLQEIFFPFLEKKGLVHFLDIRRSDEAIRRIVYQDPFTFDLDYVRALINAQLKPGINIITTEWLSGDLGYKAFNRQLTAERLLSLYPSAKIILILRNQIDLSYSMYKQYVHQGGVLNLEEYFSWSNGCLDTSIKHPVFKFDDHKIYWPSLLYSSLFTAYSNYNKQGNLNVLLFENFINSPSSFCLELLKILRLPEPDLEDVNLSPVNSGIGKRQIQVARLFNHFLPSTYNTYGLARLVYFLTLKRLSTHQLRKLLQSKLSFFLLGKGNIKVDEISKEIRDLFLEDNRKLVKYFSGPDKELFVRKYLNKTT